MRWRAADGIPIALDLNSKIFADPARAGATALEALDSAIAALADESDPAQIIRIGMSASYVDRLEGCRDALWRVVRDAREGGAVASGITAMIELALTTSRRVAGMRPSDWLTKRSRSARPTDTMP